MHTVGSRLYPRRQHVDTVTIANDLSGVSGLLRFRAEGFLLVRGQSLATGEEAEHKEENQRQHHASRARCVVFQVHGTKKGGARKPLLHILSVSSTRSSWRPWWCSSPCRRGLRPRDRWPRPGI